MNPVPDSANDAKLEAQFAAMEAAQRAAMQKECDDAGGPPPSDEYFDDLGLELCETDENDQFKPLPMTPEQGIAAMEQRIKVLEQERAEVNAVPEKFPHHNPNDVATMLAQLDGKIAQARLRLEHYRLQQAGRN